MIDNGSGSSGFEEVHEVSTNLLIAVSEFDGYPNQKSFQIRTYIIENLLNGKKSLITKGSLKSSMALMTKKDC